MLHSQPVPKDSFSPLNDSDSFSPLNLFCCIVKAAQEYLQLAEQERTKRCQIEAEKAEKLAQIEAMRETLITFLNRSFDERERNFQRFFARIDMALASRDHTQLALLLDHLVKYAQTSPLSQWADLKTVQANLNNPGHVWEF